MLVTTDSGAAKSPKLDDVTRELSERTVALAEARAKLQELESEVFALRCKGGDSTSDHRFVSLLNAFSPTALSPSQPTRGTALEEIYDRVDWVFLSSKMSPGCSPFPSARLRGTAKTEGSADEAAGHKAPEVVTWQAVAELEELRRELAKRLANTEACTARRGETKGLTSEVEELHDAVSRAHGNGEALCSAEVAATAAMATVNALLVANAAATRVQTNAAAVEPIESAMEGMHMCLSELQAGAEGLTHAVSASLAQLRSQLDSVTSSNRAADSLGSFTTLPPPRETSSPCSRLPRIHDELVESCCTQSPIGQMADRLTSHAHEDCHSLISDFSTIWRSDHSPPRPCSPSRSAFEETAHGLGRMIASPPPVVRRAALVTTPLPVASPVLAPVTRMRSAGSSPLRRSASPVRLSSYNSSRQMLNFSAASVPGGVPATCQTVSFSSSPMLSPPVMPRSTPPVVLRGSFVAGPSRNMIPSWTGQSVEVRPSSPVQVARASSPVQIVRASSPVRVTFPSEPPKVVPRFVLSSAADLVPLMARTRGGDRDVALSPEVPSYSAESHAPELLMDLHPQVESDEQGASSVQKQGQACTIVCDGKRDSECGDNDNLPASRWSRQDFSPLKGVMSNVVLPPPRPVSRTKSQSSPITFAGQASDDFQAFAASLRPATIWENEASDDSRALAASLRPAIICENEVDRKLASPVDEEHRNASTFSFADEIAAQRKAALLSVAGGIGRNEAIQAEAFSRSPSVTFLREDVHPGAPPPTARSPFETPPTSLRWWHS